MICAVAIMVLAVSGAAQAAPIQGSAGFGALGIVTENGTDLLNSTQFTMANMFFNTGGNTGDFASLPFGFQSPNPCPLDLNNMAAFTFGSTNIGTWTTTSGIIVHQTANYLNLSLVGAFTPGTMFSGLTQSPGTMNISFNKSGASISFNGAMAMDTPTLVTLSSFTATAQAERVTLEWTTESEIDNAGFNIYRAVSENGEYVQINESIIPAQGSSTQGASYQIVDEGLQNRKTYYYKLEDIDLNGTATEHGPQSATPRWIFGILGK